MKKILGALLLASVSFQSFGAESFACKDQIQSDSHYQLGIVARGSFIAKGAEIALDCVRPEMKHGSSSGHRFAACVNAFGLSYLYLHWAPAAGAFTGLGGIAAFHQNYDGDYHEASRQLKLNSVIYEVLTSNNITEKQLEYLRYRYFANYEATNQDIADFFNDLRSTRDFCPNWGVSGKKGVMSDEGIKFLNANGYKDEMDYISDTNPDKKVSEKIEDFIEWEPATIGQAINPGQFRNLIRQEMYRKGIMRKI